MRRPITRQRVQRDPAAVAPEEATQYVMLDAGSRYVYKSRLFQANVPVEVRARDAEYLTALRTPNRVRRFVALTRESAERRLRKLNMLHELQENVVTDDTLAAFEGAEPGTFDEHSEFADDEGVPYPSDDELIVEEPVPVRVVKKTATRRAPAAKPTAKRKARRKKPATTVPAATAVDVGDPGVEV